MSIKLSFFTAVSAFLLFSSCGQYPCSPSIGLRFALVSFKPAEADTVMLKRYPKGSNFSTVIDSVLVDSTLLTFTNRNDTLFPSTLLKQTLLLSQFDYRLTIPAINKTYSVTDIIEEEKKWKEPLFGAKEDCTNPITGYTIDGTRVDVQPFYEVVYLKK